MLRIVSLALITVTLAVIVGAGPGREVAARAYFSAAELARIERSAQPNLGAFDPTNSVSGEPRAIELGRFLFHDARLSGDGQVSCATCHDPELAWTDGRALARGMRQTSAHTPSLWNVSHNRWFFRDGRADSLWAQALQPIEHPDEQGGSRLQAMHLVAGDALLRELYESLFEQLPSGAALAAFPDRGRPVPEDPNDALHLAWSALDAAQQVQANQVFANMGKAIAAFEQEITVTDTPFDRFVRGLSSGDADDLDAIDGDARAGAKLFFGEARCHLCHHGPMLSDLEFHDVRVPREGAPLPARYGGIGQVIADEFNGLGQYSDDGSERANTDLHHLRRTRHNVGEFKTPGLRNVALTAPYMHSGAFQTLDDVVEHYSTLEAAAPRTHEDSERLLEPLDLSAEAKAQLVAFLESLTGPEPGAHLLAPVSPERLP